MSKEKNWLSSAKITNLLQHIHGLKTTQGDAGHEKVLWIG